MLHHVLTLYQVTPWMMNEVSKNGQGIMLGSISVPSSSRDDEGEYRCKVTWESEEYDVHDAVQYSEAATLKLLVSPRLTADFSSAKL